MEFGGSIKKLVKSLGIFIAILAVTFSLSSNAFAFIVIYGDGTPSNPKRISTCAQLESWLNGTPGTTLFNINFLITNNLDCAGLVFDNTTFLNHGSIDGGNHKIINLKLGGTSGLVYGLDNSVIKNLWLTNGDNDGLGTSLKGTFANQMISSSLENVRSSINLTCGDFCGGLVGWAQDSSITRAVYDGTLNSGHSSGGLVGSDTLYNTSNLVISKSAFLGNMSALQNSGGIVGALAENVLVEDSYVDGTLLLGPFSGGLIGGYNDTVTIVRSYTEGTGGLDIYSGGIMGGYNINVSVLHSYSSSPSSSYLIGAIEGGNNTIITYSDVHYVDSVANCRSDNSAPIVGCTSAGSYISDSLIASLGWNFTDVWKKDIGQNPTLRLTDFNDPIGIPNSGDMNDDGVQDTFQGNVELLKNSSGQWTAIETKDTNACTLGEASLLDTADIPQITGYNYATDFVSFNVYCIDAGQSFTTNIYLNRNIDISKTQLLFYNPSSKLFTKMNNVIFSHKTIGGQTFTVVSYTISDGGIFDRDGASNGKIEDPIVLAITPETSGGSYSSNLKRNQLTYSWSYYDVVIDGTNQDAVSSSDTNKTSAEVNKTSHSNNNITKSNNNGLAGFMGSYGIWIFITTLAIVPIAVIASRRKN